jgi:ankyrin repeat protein
MAALTGDLTIIGMLLAHNADPNQARTDDGVTPLFLSAQQGHLHAVYTLLLVVFWRLHVCIVLARRFKGQVESGTCKHNTPPVQARIHAVIVCHLYHRRQLLAASGASTTASTTDGNWTPQSVAVAADHPATAAWLSTVITKGHAASTAHASWSVRSYLNWFWAAYKWAVRFGRNLG